VKTQAQADTYGGVAGEAYDRCYHQACDTISNLNDTSFDQLSDGAATALVRFAFTKQSVTATTARTHRVTRRASTRRLARKTYRGSRMQRSPPGHLD
jgi:hypothetical protein